MKTWAKAPLRGELLGDIERFLLAEHAAGDEYTNDKYIHVSELTHKDFCPRATYLRIRRAREGKAPPIKEDFAFQRESIFEEGHEYHRKWQNRINRMERLWGTWECVACGYRWKAVSPQECANPDVFNEAGGPDDDMETTPCGAPRDALRYCEVIFKHKEMNLTGHADGLVIGLDFETDEGYGVGEDVLIEIKSIGDGTVRIDQPQLLYAYTYKVTDDRGKQHDVVDHRSLWQDIKRPFPSHLKQGLLYLWLWSILHPDWPVTKITFIYEYKPTSAVKSFDVLRNDDMIRELIEHIEDINYGLEHGKTPRCVEGRRTLCKHCQKFTNEEHQRDSRQSETDRSDERSDRGSRRDREDRDRSDRQAHDGATVVARRPHRAR